MTPAKARKPKVLNVGFHPPPPGGMANFIDNLEKSKIKDFYTIRGFDSDHTKWINRFRPLAWLYLPFMYLNYWMVLLSYKPDLVHIHSPGYGSFYKHEIFTRLAKARDIPVVLHIHAGKFIEFYDNLSRRRQKDVRKKLAQADLLIVLSGFWQEFSVIYTHPNESG